MSLSEQLKDLTNNFEAARQQSCRTNLEREFNNTFKKFLLRSAEMGDPSVTVPATQLGVARCTGAEVQRFYAEKNLTATLVPRPNTWSNLPTGVFACANNMQALLTSANEKVDPKALLGAYDLVRLTWNS